MKVVQRRCNDSSRLRNSDDGPNDHVDLHRGGRQTRKPQTSGHGWGLVVVVAVAFVAVLSDVRPLFSSGSLFATAQEEGAAGGEGGIDVPSTIQALSRSCPTEMARLTPCIDTSTDLTQCTECVSSFIVANQDTFDGNTDTATAGQGPEVQEGNNGTATTATEDMDPSSSMDTCTMLENALCTGLETCGASCGLVRSESFLTFGSDCEQLFANLVSCVLTSQNVGTECNLEDLSCSSDSEEDSNESSGGRNGSPMLLVVNGLVLVAGFFFSWTSIVTTVLPQ